MLSDTQPPGNTIAPASATEPLARQPMPARVLCILGMHRSGTSCLTGSLQEAGLALGDCHTWNPHNRKGNRENQAFVDLNDAVLAANNSAWDRPPEKVAWTGAQLQEARALLGAHAAEEIFGFKDPRTLLVLDGWKRACPDMEFVGIFRHPLAVARSLNKRSGMPFSQGLGLWARYNSLLLREYRVGEFPLLCFDEAEDLLQEKIACAARNLGLNPSAGALSFYSTELRSAGGEGLNGLPWKIARLYQALLKRSM